MAPPDATADAPLPGTDHLPRGGSVLVVRLSALGDIVFALETVAALAAARPDVAIDFLVDDRWAGLLHGHPQIRHVLCFPRTRPLRVPGHLLALRRRRYDVVLDLHGIQKSAWNVRAVRATHKLGFAAPGSREGAARAYTRAVELPAPLPHRAARGYHLLRALDLPSDPVRPVLPAPDAPPHVPWPDGSPRVVLQPGTSAFAAFKRWPAERFAALASQLTAKGAAVLIGHGPGEADLADSIAAQAPGSRILDGGPMGLLGYAAALGTADVVVAADTGPLHLAAAAGTRVVALFGPKDPDLYGPRGDGHQVLFQDVPCRPCTRRDCPAPACVQGIPTEDVLAAPLEAAR